MADLTVGGSYPIEEAKTTTTKYAEAIVVRLSSEDERIKVFLPKRFAGVLSDQNLGHLEGVRVKYLGGEYHDLEFY